MLQCPICNQSNACQVDTPQQCWCMNTGIPKKLQLLVSSKGANQCCICQRCVMLFKQNPEIIYNILITSPPIDQG
ncbi:MAG: cysteine-rich CWC family protein [Psychrobium sp.]